MDWKFDSWKCKWGLTYTGIKKQDGFTDSEMDEEAYSFSYFRKFTHYNFIFAHILNFNPKGHFCQSYLKSAA